MKAATAALGWKLQLFTYTGAGAKAALIQAVQKRVDFIAITGAGRPNTRPVSPWHARRGFP